MQPASSLLHEGYAVVRVRDRVVLSRSRVLTRHGQHGALHCVPLEVALQLLDRGAAKLPGEVRRQHLRDHIERLAGE